MADKEKQGKLSKSNWEAFFSVFIKPFENCDVSSDNLLDFNEFQECFKERLENIFLSETEFWFKIAGNRCLPCFPTIYIAVKNPITSIFTVIYSSENSLSLGQIAS